MIKVALVGAGKMGISHLSILGAHHSTSIVGVCDNSKLVLNALEKYSRFPVFNDFDTMLEKARPDAVFVAVPPNLHFEFAHKALSRGIHVFVEKPFCISAEESGRLVALAEKKGLVNQVGYHNKFVGTFQEVKKIMANNGLGRVHHFVAEAYGPVVTTKKSHTWRSDNKTGGGCLMDYASHVIDLTADILAPISSVDASLIKTIYSDKVDDAVYSIIRLENGCSGVLSVNWSDETYRKMSTSITIIGEKGKIISDSNELRAYFKEGANYPGYSAGWNTRYLTDLTEQVQFYLRGEEYSGQIDFFIMAIQKKVPNTINNFRSAWHTNQAIERIRQEAK